MNAAVNKPIAIYRGSRQGRYAGLELLGSGTYAMIGIEGKLTIHREVVEARRVNREQD